MTTDVKLVQHTFPVLDSFDPSLSIPGVALSSMDLITADPPYNFGVKYADDPTGDRLPQRIYEIFCQNVIWTLSRHLRPGGTLWWLCPSEHMDFIPALMEAASLSCLYRIIKQETFAQYQQKTLTDDYRMLFCYAKPAGEAKNIRDWGKSALTFNPDAIRIPSLRQEKYNDKRANPKGRVPGQVWNIRRLQGTSDDHVDWHKAQLAPELLQRIVRGWTNPGDQVMDAFAGSGNMGLCCVREGRNATLVDQSGTYMGKITDRIKHEANREARLVPSSS